MRPHVSPQPVHVLHVVHHLQPGGMEYGLIKLVNGLRGSRIRSTICSTAPADPSMAAQLPADVRLIQLGRGTGTDVRMMWQLYRVIGRERPDIVHTHAWGTLVEGYAAARAARVPAVIHGEHGTLQLRPRQVYAQRWVWTRVDRLLSVSSRLAERMAAAVGIPLDGITVVRNGVDLSQFDRCARSDARQALGVDADTVLLGHAGRLVEVKDQASLVQAAAQLKAAGLRFLLLLAGDGPLRPTLDGLITELGVGDCVRLLGHRSDIARFHAALDVYVLSSRSEGMPNTILEAMASGVAVVSTRVGGADELIVHDQTGLLVPAGRPDLLAEALGCLVTDGGKRAAMGTEGQRRARAHFSLDAMVQGYARVYEEALSTGRGA
jgi:sugar transferase (PEP-CTERM/EpsH1 system associated)